MDVRQIREFRETLRKLKRQLDSQLKEGTECCGVSLVQCHTLMELEKRGKANLKDLSGSLELDKSTVSRGIDILVKNGFVQREVDENNRRYVLLSLTDKGKTTCSGIDQLCDNYYVNLFRHIPEDRHSQVLESLNLFADAMSAMKTGSGITCDNTVCATGNG